MLFCPCAPPSPNHVLVSGCCNAKLYTFSLIQYFQNLRKNSRGEKAHVNVVFVFLFVFFFFPEKRQKRLYIASYSRYPKLVKLSEETVSVQPHKQFTLLKVPQSENVFHTKQFSLLALHYLTHYVKKSLKTPTTYLKKPKFQQLLLTTF